MRTLKWIFFLLLSVGMLLSEMFLFENKNYYMISLLLVIYTLIMAFSNFDKRQFNTKKIVVIAVLIALAVAGRIGFSFLPQFKPAVAIIIIIAVCFGSEIGFMSGAMNGLVSNFYFGQGPWTPWQMFCLGLIGLIAGIIFHKSEKRSVIILCIYGIVSTIIIYGGIMNPISVMFFQPNINFKIIIGSYIAGISFDVVHAVSTVVFLSLLAKPMIKLIDRIKIKYDLEGEKNEKVI